MPTSEVDLVWEEVVRALWEGKLGHTAKVSGAGPHSSGSHVICVYVDPFWETSEVERVLTALRELCDVKDAIKFKADGVSQLGLYKGNEFGIPPSFYSANRGATTVSLQKVSNKAVTGESMESARSAQADPNKDTKWGGRGSQFVKRDAPKPRSRSSPMSASRGGCSWLPARASSRCTSPRW